MEIQRYLLKRPNIAEVFEKQPENLYEENIEWYFEQGKEGLVRVGIRSLGSRTPFTDDFLTTEDCLYIRRGESPLVVRSECNPGLFREEEINSYRRILPKTLSGESRTYKPLNMLISMLFSGRAHCYLSSGMVRGGGVLLGLPTVLTFSINEPSLQLYERGEEMPIYQFEKFSP